MSTDLLVLVEGASDAAVLAVLAEARGPGPLPLLATGGAMGAERALRALDHRPSVVLALCDEREAPVVARTLTGPEDRLFVCRADLEEELVRALGADRALEVLAGTGDLRSFRTLQGQPQHRDRPVERQLHRFIEAGSGRKARIGAAFAAALPAAGVPEPLADLLDRVAADR